MQKVKPKYIHDNQYEYTLLEPKKISLDKAKSLIYKLTGDEEISVIKKDGISAPDKGFWVKVTNIKDGRYVKIMNFENEDDFEIIK